MLIIRQKQFAAKDYKDLSFFGRRVLKKLRNSLAKRLKKARIAAESKESKRNKFINKFTSDKEKIATISNTNRENKLAELESSKQYINELKKEAENKAKKITERDRNILNKAKYIGVPTALGIGGVVGYNIYNKDRDEKDYLI